MQSPLVGKNTEYEMTGKPIIREYRLCSQKHIFTTVEEVDAQTTRSPPGSHGTCEHFSGFIVLEQCPAPRTETQHCPKMLHNRWNSGAFQQTTRSSHT